MLPANSQAPAFQLDNQSGDPVALPDDNASIICFVKQDCPTCQLVMPVLEQLHAEGHRIIAIGQTTEGTQQLITDFNLTLPFLDDSKLKISFAFDIDTVPTLIPLEHRAISGRLSLGLRRKSGKPLFPSQR